MRRPAAPRFDCFISYATEEHATAVDVEAALETNGLSVFLDDPRDPQPPPWRVLTDALVLRIRRVFRRPLAEAAGRLTAAEVDRRIAEWLDAAACMVVLWSRSHRGSLWSRRELDLFEALHAARPIFVIRGDDAPFAPPTAQWVELSNARQLTRDRIVALTQPAASAAPRVSALDPLLRPKHWSELMLRERSGTTLVELVALASRVKDETASRLVGAAVTSSAVVSATVAVLGAVAWWTAAQLPVDRSVFRHLALVLTTLAATAAWVGLQTSLPALLPAAFTAALAGATTQLALAMSGAGNVGAGAAGGAVLGALLGGLLVHEWSLRRPMRGATAWRVAARFGAVGLLTAIVLAGVCLLLAVDTSSVRGWRLVAALAVVALLPAAAVSVELAALRRARERVMALVPAAGLLLLAAAVALVVSLTGEPVDQQDPVWAAVGGVLVGTCAAAIYLAPGAFMSTAAPTYVRTLAGSVAVSVTLFGLWPVFAWLQPSDSFTRDLGDACQAYLIAFVAAAALAHAWPVARTDRGRVAL